MLWPPQSPELYVMESAWDYRRTVAMSPRCRKKKLCAGVPRRVAAVVGQNFVSS